MNINQKDLESVLKAVKELSSIKTELVTTENIKNIVFKLPDDKPLDNKDTSIQNASLKQIAILNEMFNLKFTSGGYEN